uniref:Mitochondrial fission process protein 1 n=1 Tax=Moniliophthora roreri TaxID=221103 RepID=A0A0W0FKZ5_MONRR
MLSTTTTTIDSVEKTVDKLADQNVDSTDSELRYAAYGARLRTALRASSRYIAFTRVIWASQAISSPLGRHPRIWNLMGLSLGALPAFTIHTAVKQAKKAFVNVKNPRIKMWGLTLTGLAIIPSLPYIFDHPVEHVTEKAFEWIKERLAAQKDCSKGEDGKHEP